MSHFSLVLPQLHAFRHAFLCRWLDAMNLGLPLKGKIQDDMRSGVLLCLLLEKLLPKVEFAKLQSRPKTGWAAIRNSEMALEVIRARIPLMTTLPTAVEINSGLPGPCVRLIEHLCRIVAVNRIRKELGSMLRWYVDVMQTWKDLNIELPESVARITERGCLWKYFRDGVAILCACCLHVGKVQEWSCDISQMRCHPEDLSDLIKNCEIVMQVLDELEIPRLWEPLEFATHPDNDDDFLVLQLYAVYRMLSSSGRDEGVRNSVAFADEHRAPLAFDKYLWVQSHDGMSWPIIALEEEMTMTTTASATATSAAAIIEDASRIVPLSSIDAQSPKKSKKETVRGAMIPDNTEINPKWSQGNGTVAVAVRIALLEKALVNSHSQPHAAKQEEEDLGDDISTLRNEIEAAEKRRLFQERSLIHRKQELEEDILNEECAHELMDIDMEPITASTLHLMAAALSITTAAASDASSIASNNMQHRNLDDSVVDWRINNSNSINTSANKNNSSFRSNNNNNNSSHLSNGLVVPPPHAEDIRDFGRSTFAGSASEPVALDEEFEENISNHQSTYLPEASPLMPTSLKKLGAYYRNNGDDNNEDYDGNTEDRYYNDNNNSNNSNSNDLDEDRVSRALVLDDGLQQQQQHQRSKYLQKLNWSEEWQEEKNHDSMYWDASKTSESIDVSSGTINKLIEIFTSSTTLAEDKVMGLVIGFRYVTSASVFLSKLRSRYVGCEMGVSSASLDESKVKQVRSCIRKQTCAILKGWLVNVPSDFMNAEVHGKLKEWIDDDSMWLGIAAQRRVVQQHFVTTMQRLAAVSNAPVFSCHGGNIAPPLSSPALIRLSAEKIARSFTVFVASALRYVDPLQLMMHRHQALLEAAALSMQITKWTVRQVLSGSSIRERSSILSLVIHIGNHMRAYNNLEGVVAIVAALKSKPVFRLKKTWNALHPQSLQVWQGLEAFVSPANEYKAIRSAVRAARPPFLPYLGLVKLDLNKIDDQYGGDVIQESLCNLEKAIAFGNACGCVLRCQCPPYEWPDVNQETVSILAGANELTEEQLMAMSQSCDG